MSEATPTHGQAVVQQRVADGPKSGARTWYDVLELSIDASAADVRKAYERALALVEGRNIGGFLMHDPVAADSVRADVEAAFAVLGDAERRAEYDDRLTRPSTGDTGPHPPAVSPERSDEASHPPIEERGAEERSTSSPSLKILAPAADEGIKFETPKTWPSSDPDAPAPSDTTPPSERRTRPPSMIPVTAPIDEAPVEALPSVASAPVTLVPGTQPPTLEPATLAPTLAPVSAEGAAVSSAPTPLLPEAGEIAGSVIRELRESRGLTLEEVADATKIRKPYLKAIEEDDLPNLPARVYLRGFLTQVGRVLRVDRNRLADAYLQFVERKSSSI